MEMNFPKLEEEILKYWSESKVFEKSIKQRKKAPDFVFYEGPPTANGRPGIHHVLARSFKDIICRYKTMQGFRVLRKAGWDTHGLPVELEIEKELGLKSKKDIEKYGIAKFNKECRQSVWKYKSEWEKLTERIGFWLDMEHPYITYATDYIETLWWIIKQIWQKGLLYQGYKVVPYCPRCGTPLSSHEVAQGYKKIKEPSIYIKLKVNPPAGGQKSKVKKSYLLVWTTTPWTLPGNVAVAINPKFDYVLAEFNRENLILAKERLSVLGEGYKIVKEFKGKELLGLEYESLFGPVKSEKKSYFVIAGDFVSLDEGTGLVHIAPAFGEEDMDVGRKNNLPILLNVDEAGKFKAEVKNWAGMWVKDADPLIIEDLRKRKLLFKEELYEHDYPFCWRCSTALLYYAKTSWFIRMQKVKKQLIENNQKINWVPSRLKEGRFGEWLKELKDWAFSRERYWGTPLPIWKCEKCEHQEVIGSKKDLLSQSYSTNKYYILRHGFALRNQKKLISCWPEVFHCPLTLKGKRQIKIVARKLEKEKIDLIISSDLLRTRQTAEIVAKELGLKIKLDARLRELDMGVFNGKKSEEFYKVFPVMEERFFKKPEKGESWNECKMRVVKFIKSLDKKYKNKKILIVGHGDPLWLLEGAIKSWSDEELLDAKREHKNYIQTGEIRKIEFKDLPYNENGELDFHRPYIDEIRFSCPKCGNSMKRVEDLIDVWFDSGAMPFGQAHFPFAWPSAFAKASADKQNKKLKPPELFPADYISEAVDQTRGWFYTLLAISTLLGLGTPYKNVISLGHILDEKGEKMSKSKGNVVDPWQIIEKYGVDALRWYFFTVNQPGDSKLFSERGVDQSLKKFLMTLWHSFIFWETYGKISNIKYQISKIQIKNQNLLDRWIVSRLNETAREVTESLDKYDVTASARAIEDFVINDLSNWYIRRSRRRFQRPGSEEELEEASEILGYVLFELSKLTAPFIPFLGERIYKNVKCQMSHVTCPRTRTSSVRGRQKSNVKGPESVHLEDFPKANKKLIDKKLNEQMDLIRQIVALGLKARAEAGIKVRQPLTRLKIKNSAFAKASADKQKLTHSTGSGQEIKNNKELLNLIKEELNVKEVVFDPKIKEEVELDTEITAELREEGMIREIIRNIQDMRKEEGYKPFHRIIVRYSLSSQLREAWRRWEEYLKKEIQAESLIEGAKEKEVFDREREVQIDGQKIWLGIRRV